MAAIILENWNFMRFLRLGMGLWLIFESLSTHDTAFMILGGLFIGQAVFNMGCCGSGGCGVDTRKKAYSKIEETTFEEIK